MRLVTGIWTRGGQACYERLSLTRKGEKAKTVTEVGPSDGCRVL